jgi:DNA-directed RNA polymerase specialized sigma24 family protein
MNLNNLDFANWFNQNYSMLVSACSIIAYNKQVGKEVVDASIEKVFVKWYMFDSPNRISPAEHWVLKKAIKLILTKEPKFLNTSTVDLSIEELLAAFYLGLNETNVSNMLKQLDIETRAIFVLKNYLAIANEDISYILKVDAKTINQRMEQL